MKGCAEGEEKGGGGKAVQTAAGARAHTLAHMYEYVYAPSMTANRTIPGWIA